MIDTERLQKISLYLNRFEPIPDDEWAEIVPLLKQKHFSKGEYLVRCDDIDTRIAFIIKGGFRHYFIDEKADEKTTDFCIEGEFAGAVDALSEDPSPSREWQEAFEETDTVLLEKDELEAFIATRPAFQNLFRKVIFEYFKMRTDRQADLMTSDLGLRYKSFLHRYPTLSDRVPQYQIASFLNMTPETLSRVKKRMEL